MKAMTRWIAVACAAAGLGAAACDGDDGAAGGSVTPDAGGGDTGGAGDAGGDTGGTGDTGGPDVGGDTAGPGGDGAGPGDAAGGDTGGDAGGAAPLTLATFNAGLAHGFVPYAAERLPALTAAIAAIDTDVVCLQEVWEPDDIQAVIDGAKAAFPHEYHVITEEGEGEGTDPACPPAEAEPLKECVDTHCAGTDNLAGCALDNCGTEFSATSPGCQQCLAANIGSNDVAKIFQACAEGSSKYTYEGRNGLVLLSRLPLTDTDHVILDSYLTRRVVLRARVDAGGPVDVLCTHLTAALDEVPYQGEYGTWVGEQEHQVEQLVAWTAAIADPAPRRALLGDMNAGPAIGADIDAESPTVYEALVAAGYTSPVVELDPPLCTWCASNTLVDDASTDRVIDHIMLSGFGSATAERILTDLVTVELEGGPTQMNLSDHFGTRVRIDE